MYAVREDPGRLAIFKDQDSKAVAAMLAKKNNGFQVAVLSRTHKLLESLSRALDEQNVEHHHCGRTTKVMDTEAFRRVHALFKLRHNPYDNFSFTLAREFLGCGDEEYLKILEDSLAFSESNFQVWFKTTRQPVFIRWASSEPWSFSALIQFAREITMDPDSSVCLKIAQTCADKGMTLQEYLDWVATFDVQDDVVEGSKAAIQLMTIHASKGLEFETVILIGVNEGILPSKQASARDPNVEEERRLAYVAMTRAERELVLAVRPEESTYQYEGAAKPRIYHNPVSRFIGEIYQ
jgi:DNA helicase-2/ATP-dependent DNA helicase PcrA